ncbi:MAG TPA: hypothetical protein VJ417_14625, partial [Candidatus Glassbacteria bacterium]|nr:hypothetical protein [Candidatus Glassbacteria bacterium]
RFCLPAWYTDQGGIRAVLRSASLPMKFMVGSFTMIHMGLSLLFVLFPLMYYFTEWVEKRLHFDFFSAGIYVLVFSVAVVQALANSGDNSRYELPVEPLVMAIGLIALLSIVKRKAIRRKT